MNKSQARTHRQAQQLLDLNRELREEEKDFVLRHWQASAAPEASLAGAYFTPAGLARDLTIEVTGHRILDLCAGIGRLSFHARGLTRHHNGCAPRELLCVEINPLYVAVGRRILPEATWVCADITTLNPATLGTFDCVIANPPYGRVPTRAEPGSGWRARRFEYQTIEIAAQFSGYGVFLVPQTSAPFRYSGQPCFQHDTGDEHYQRFSARTGITLEPSCGIDTSYYREDWHEVSPTVEVVTCDFTTQPDVESPGQQLALLA